MESVRTQRRLSSLRLWFRFEGDRIELTRQERLHMVPPPLVAEMPQEGTHGGTWVEVNDGRGRRLAVQLVPGDPFRQVNERGCEGKMRADVFPCSSGNFCVVIPDLPAAKAVRVLASHDGHRARLSVAARRVAEFRLEPPPQHPEAGK